MRIVLVQSREDIPAYRDDIQRLSAAAAPRYSCHVLEALTVWFDSFHSDSGALFAELRGRNLIGRASTLDSPFFLLIYSDQVLVAFAPLFRFSAQLGDGPGRREVICFCPDSTVFFYNDILAMPGSEEAAAGAMTGFFRQYQASAPYVVLFNHMPSCSVTLPLLARSAAELPYHRFKASVSPLFWRGGVYPWNRGRLLGILEAAAEDPLLGDDTRNAARESAGMITSAHRAMLMFEKNHLPIKAAIYRTLCDAGQSEAAGRLRAAIDSILQSSPVKYPYIALPETGEEFSAAMSQSRRYYYRRYGRQFLESGGSFMKVCGRSISERDIRDFIALHRDRWGADSNVISGSTEPFVRSFLATMAANGLLTLFFAEQDSRRVAAVCCIDFPGRREFFSSGRSREAEKTRAGKLLLHHSIIDAIQHGFRQFDLGYGDEAYKSDFDWSCTGNNVLALFHDLNPAACRGIFPLYEELML